MKNNAKKRNDPKSATDAECRIAAELLGIELGNQLCKPLKGKFILVANLQRMVNRKIAFEKLNLKVPLTYGRIKQITGVSKPTLCKWAKEFKKNGTW